MGSVFGVFGNVLTHKTKRKHVFYKVIFRPAKDRAFRFF